VLLLYIKYKTRDFIISGYEELYVSHCDNFRDKNLSSMRNTAFRECIIVTNVRIVQIPYIVFIPVSIMYAWALEHSP